MDMKKLLELMDSMTKAAKKPTGPKFPGYWKGTDPASKSKTKMVGSAEESILKDLHATAKEKVTEWNLTEKFNSFKEEDTPPAYSGVDPVVRQRMGMEPASQGEIRDYLDKNPPGLKTGTGEPVKTGTGQPIQSAGQQDVARAADLASPDRAQAVAKEPQPVAPVAQPAPAVKPVAQAVPTTSPQPTEIKPLPPATTQVAAPVTPPAKPVPTMPKNAAPGSWQDIWKQNPDIKNPDLIYPGQRIKLPDSDEDYVVQKGDTLSKISNLYKSGDIGGRVVSSDEPGREVATPTQSKGGSGPGSASFAAQDPRRTDIKPSTPAAPPTTPAVATQPTANQIAGHLPGTMLFRNVKDPTDPTKSQKVSFIKQPDGTYRSLDGQYRVKNPANIQSLDSDVPHFSFADKKQAERYPQLNADFRSNLERASKDSGIPITVVSSSRTPEEQEQLHRDYRAGKPGVYGAPPREVQSHRAHAIDARPEQIAALRDWLAKNDPKGNKYNLGFLPGDPVHVQHAGYRSGMKENKNNNLIAGKYHPDEFDQMVDRVKKLAHQQEKKHGPVDLAKLAQRLRDLDKKETTNEVEDPATNKQDPDIQATSQTSPNQDPTAVKQQQLDQQVDMATAKGTMSGLKTALGPQVDTNALTNAVTKISDGKPLTSPEAKSMTALTPLISKAAETPQTAMALKTALNNAAMLAKQGK